MKTLLPYELKLLAEDWTNEGEYDLLFLAGGTAPRVYEILRRGASHDAFKHLCFFDFEERKVTGGDIAAYEEFARYGIKTTRVPCSVSNASEAIKSEEMQGIQLGPDLRVAVDITGFTRPYMFLVLKYLKERLAPTTITAFYTEPQAYLFPDRLFDSYRASSGPLTVVEVPSFSGSGTRATEKLLVVILGFDGAIASFVADEVSADRTILVNGFPSYMPKFKDISLSNNERLLSSVSSRSNTFYARASNPFEVFNVLERCIGSCTQVFVSIAPLGPKPMALGACIYALAHESVRILYPLPRKYASRTTSKVWQCWSCRIPMDFGWVVGH